LRFSTPHPVLRTTLSLRERDDKRISILIALLFALTPFVQGTTAEERATSQSKPPQ
jgi:hypothetical protein